MDTVKSNHYQSIHVFRETTSNVRGSLVAQQSEEKAEIKVLNAFSVSFRDFPTSRML